MTLATGVLLHSRVWKSIGNRMVVDNASSVVAQLAAKFSRILQARISHSEIVRCSAWVDYSGSREH
jgi:hypothetical protein